MSNPLPSDAELSRESDLASRPPPRRRRRWKRVVFAFVLLALAVFLVPTIWLKPWSVNHFYLRTLAELLWQSPTLCSQLHVLDWRSDELDDYSLAQRERSRALVRRELGVLHRFDRAKMTKDEQLSYDVMDWFLADIDARQTFGPEIYAFEQLGGLHVAFPSFMTDHHEVTSEKQGRAYVARVSKIGAAFDQLIATAKDDAARGIVPPRFVLAKVTADARAFMDLAPLENPLTKTLDTKLAAIAKLEPAVKNELHEQLVARIGDTVKPAYERFLALLAELEKASTDDPGMWKLSDGDRRYALYLRSGTASNKTPDEVHALGLAEVAKHEAEIRAILVSQGIAAEDVAAALRGLAQEERFRYPDVPASRAAAIADFQRILDDMDAKVDRMFLERAAVGLDVQAVPAFREKTAPGGQYFPPPLDNSKKGIFFANVAAPHDIARFGMRTLAYHEGTPGHHYQFMMARQNKSLPMFRQLVPFNSYSEGWALYAEQLAAENGFEEDPFDRIGFLEAQLFRAARLVVDTGMHAKRWSREQAIAYMMAHTASPEREIVIEVERYAVWPGQACGYMVGMLTILELRERAKAALGAKYDPKEFHAAVLRPGALPLPLLERVVDDWIASRR